MAGSGLTGKMGGVFHTPYHSQVNVHPEDVIMEAYYHTMVGGDDTLTMGTDTTYVNYCSFAFATPVHATNKPYSISAKGATVTVNCTTTYPVWMYFFGSSNGTGSHIINLSRYGGSQHPDGIVWEIIHADMDNAAGTFKCVAATHLDYIDRPMFVLGTQVISTAPDADGVQLNELSTIDFTVECANSAEVAMLVGGRSEAATPADNATNIDDELIAGKPLYFGGRSSIKPGDLVGEFIKKTLTSASPSVATITAANDCEIIRHIEMLLPVYTNATETAIAWNGDQGTTAGIVTANTLSDTVDVLVLGR